MAIKKPEWLRIRYRKDQQYAEVKQLLKHFGVNTVCEEAICPNQIECFNNKTATFMILGSICTRNCRFCAVDKGMPKGIDPDEPINVASAVNALGLKHVVITSVTRDDLEDGGANQFASVIQQIKRLNDDVIIEVLIPDFNGNREALKQVVDAKPHIINHNIETIPRLYKNVRPMAIYQRSMDLLAQVKAYDPEILTKSGLMVGLGETTEEVFKVLIELNEIKCNLITIGQYLAPSKEHHPIVEFIHPDIFKQYHDKGIELGFDYVASAPLVRSSYNAGEAFQKSLTSKNK